jgi:hypothetical protein
MDKKPSDEAAREIKKRGSDAPRMQTMAPPRPIVVATNHLATTRAPGRSR